MPFKPLSNALLSPYKVPFGVYLYNYLITNNLRRLLNNSFFFTHPPHLLCIFCQYILRSGGCWVVGVNGFYKVHCKSTHHHHPTFNPSYHQHSTFITQHPTPNIQHPTSNTHHPTSITHHPTFNPTHHHHPTSNTHHPTFNPINFIISFFLCKFAVK